MHATVCSAPGNISAFPKEAKNTFGSSDVIFGLRQRDVCHYDFVSRSSRNLLLETSELVSGMFQMFKT